MTQQIPVSQRRLIDGWGGYCSVARQKRQVGFGKYGAVPTESAFFTWTKVVLGTGTITIAVMISAELSQTSTGGRL
jgi:hypothetical protein